MLAFLIIVAVDLSFQGKKLKYGIPQPNLFMLYGKIKMAPTAKKLLNPMKTVFKWIIQLIFSVMQQITQLGLLKD